MYMEKVSEIKAQEIITTLSQSDKVIKKAPLEMDQKLLNKNIKIQLIFNISLLCLGVFISLLVSFITNLSIVFLYAFLICVPFICFGIFMNYYELKKLRHLVKEKRFSFFMFIYFVKYFTIVVLLALTVILLILNVKSSVINFYGILFGVIILIAIIMSSVYFFKKSLNTFQK